MIINVVLGFVIGVIAAFIVGAVAFYKAFKDVYK